ncbi:MAG: YchJ family metal-binding protein [Pseudomonadota bacterium]
MKISPNAQCPCHSGEKYKKCCQPYHKGIFPSNALKLMRSRYSAYSLSLADYILKTTHPNNPDYTDETALWKENILDFCDNTQFLGLKINEFIDGETVAYVTFDAILDSGSLKEKSRFLKEDGRWLYEGGSFD